MSILKRIINNNPSESDKGISVREALKLVENSDYFDDIISGFNIDEIRNEFIEIAGAKTLVKSISQMEKKLIKKDINTPLNKVHCKGFTEEGQAILEISEVVDEQLIKIDNTDLVCVETVYSVRSDYFNNLYELDKYLQFLLKKEYNDIIGSNIKMLEEKNKENTSEKKFRLVIDEKGKVYVRAMTSVERYKDYNIAFSVFVTLIKLHELYKYNEESFEISTFNFTESDVRIIFKNKKAYKFIDESKLSFSLVLTNDEIKREAVRLNGVFSIELSEDKDVYINPEEGISEIISFTHSQKFSNVKIKLTQLNTSIKDFILETIDDFEFIKEIKKPDDIREYLAYKTKFAKDKEFKLYKNRISNILTNRVNSIFQLLEMASQIDNLFKDEHIQAKDFWRYKLYQALIEEAKKKHKKQL